MRRWKRPRLTLGRKLYAVAVLLGVLAIALVANAFVPFAKANGEVANARQDVATALAAEATGRLACEWFWHLGSLALIGADAESEHVDRAREATLAASRDWVRSERGSEGVAGASRLSSTFTDIARQGSRVVDAMRAGDAARAGRILIGDVYTPATHSYALPLDGAIRREDSEMREAFVRLAGATGASGPLASDRLTSRVLQARTRSEVSLAASSFMRLRLIHAQVLAAALIDPAHADVALLSVLDQIAANEIMVWSSVAASSGSSAIISAVAKTGSSDRELSRLAGAIAGHFSAGDIASARRLFVEELAPATEAEIQTVNAALAADERFIETAMTGIVKDEREVAAVMALIALIALALAFVSALVARRIAHRLATTTAAVRSFTPGEHAPITLGGTDEFSELAGAFNVMSQDVHRAREQEKRFLQLTVQATESERMRLAAELHDGPIQRLTGLLYGLERAGTRMDRGQLDGLGDFMKDARTKVSSEVAALRHMLSELRPPVLDERGLGVAVRDHLSGFAHREGIECDVDVRLDDRVSESLETTMYRILQEALANVSKHAEASRVGVALWNDDGTVHLVIVDDGRGFDPGERADVGGEHFGITGMIGRAAYAGGSLEIESAPGKGTVVSATFPTSLPASLHVARETPAPRKLASVREAS